jgi:hypothetical protein
MRQGRNLSITANDCRNYIIRTSRKYQQGRQTRYTPGSRGIWSRMLPMVRSLILDPVIWLSVMVVSRHHIWRNSLSRQPHSPRQPLALCRSCKYCAEYDSACQTPVDSFQWSNVPTPSWYLSSLIVSALTNLGQLLVLIYIFPPAVR